MVSNAYSLREAINVLKQHQDQLGVKIGKSQIERLLFNLEEISLDLESIASGLVDVATEKAPIARLPEIIDSFQYGSIPHILDHLETIEELLENNTISGASDETTTRQEAANASPLHLP